MKKFAIIILLTLAAGALLVLPQNVAFTMRTKTPKAPDVTKTFSKHDKDCHFAVVCGGVHSVAEFDAANLNDWRVGGEYSMINYALLHEDVLQKDMWVFMIYRVGNQFYYTKHKVLVHKGEKILTDYVYAILQRCGNLFLLDIDLANPTSDVEPSPAELGDIATPYTIWGGGDSTSQPVYTSAPDVPDTNSPPEGSTTFPGGFCCTGGSPGTPPTPPSKPNTPVPEPKEFYLTLAGLLCIFVMVRIR